MRISGGTARGPAGGPAGGAAGGPARLVISATVFVDLLGFTVILPGLPFLATRLGADGATFGLVMSAYSIAQVVCAPLLGRLSDRYGRRPLVLLALAGSAVSLALTGVAGSLAWLLACRVLAGACGGSISVAQAYLADTVPPERRTAAMAEMGAAIGLAFVVGPALGALLAPWGFPACAFAAAALATLNLLAATLWLPEPRRPATALLPEPRRPATALLPEPRRPATARLPESSRPGAAVRLPGSSPLRSVADERPQPDVAASGSRSDAFPDAATCADTPSGAFAQSASRPGGLWRMPLVVVLAGVGFLAMAAFVGMETTLAFLGRDAFGWGAGEVGFVLAAAGLAMVVVQAGPVRIAAKRWGDARVAAAGAAVMAVSMAAIPFAAGPGMVAAVCVLAAGHGMVTPTLASLLAGAGRADRRGTRLGIGQSAAAGGRIFGPLASGLLFDLGPVAPYLAGAVMAGLSLTGALTVRDGTVRDGAVRGSECAGSESADRENA